MNASVPSLMDVPVRDDERLVDLARAIEEHRPSLRTFLRRRLRNEEDVSDALQETTLRLVHYQAQHVVEAPVSLLYRVAENVAVDFSRREQTRHASVHCPIEDVQLVSPEPSPEQLASAEQDLGRFIDALERLSAKCQDVFILSRMEGLSYPQIAERCGISAKMVEKYMSRALAQLRAEVGDGPCAAP